MPIDPVSIGIKVGLMAAQMALTATNKTEGPRLDGLDVTLADYGTPIPRFWGRRRIDGVPIIWAEKLREKKVESKTKGGKYSEYKYYGTWAVLICDHAIDAVTRVWLDKQLTYDVSNAGPISIVLGMLGSAVDTSNVKLTRGVNFRVYLGSEDQEPDPRMEAWCEDRYGPDSCPAYRGCSYIVFQDIPLEKFGNRIPQITVEAVHTKTDAFLWEERESDKDLANFGYSADYTRFYLQSGTSLEVWDTPSRTKLFDATIPVGTNTPFAMSNDAIYAVSGFSSLYRMGLDGGGTLLTTDFAQLTAGGAYYVGGLVCISTSFDGALYYAEGANSVELASGVSFNSSHYFEDTEGQAWAVGSVTGEDKVGFAPMPEGGETIIDTLAGGQAYAMDNGEGQFFMWQEGNLYLIDKGTFAIVDSAPAVTLSAGARQFSATRIGAASIWFGNQEYSTRTLELLRTVNTASWSGADIALDTVYDPINHALICDSNVPGLTWRYLDRVGNPGIVLADIVTDVAGWCGLDTVDASDLDQVVLGYSVTQGSGKDMIAPLLDMHDSDARPHDFSVQFIKRGGASGGTLLTADFVRDGDSPRYVVTKKQDTDIPRRMTVNFADNGKDQQTNTVISQRPLDAVDGVREQSIDLTTYVTTPSEAQQLSDRRFRRLWNEREEIQNGLTMQEAALEPGDIRTLSLDGVTQTARLVKMTLTQGHIACEWRRDALGLSGLGSGAGADMDGRDEEVIYVAAPTKAIVLDIPLLNDADDTTSPRIYYAAGSYGSGDWPGAVFYKSDFDGDEYEQWNAVESAGKAVWGICLEVLPDANPNLWDRGSSLSVRIFGTVTSCTEAEVDADPALNLAAIGREMVNFTTATLEADGTYTLSGFKRGRRGTEGECALHTNEDAFVLATSLNADALGLSEVGQEMTFKGQTLLRDFETAPTIAVDYEGRSLKPYAPASLAWTTDGTDLFGTIVRRTRLGGAWVGGTTIPLSENSEAYEVDILDGVDVVRTISVTGTNAFTYTAAQISADGFTVAAPPDSNAYQLSDAVGRGFALAA